MRGWLVAVVLGLGVLVASGATVRAGPSAHWIPVGMWSGAGNERTPMFRTNSGELRILWSASNVAPAGIFQVLVYESDGMLLQVAVNRTGSAGGTALVAAPVGSYSLQIHAPPSVTWTVTVEDQQ